MKGIGELLEALIPYSQRHFSRVDRFVRSTYLLDYTLTQMSVIEPETEVRAFRGSLVHSHVNSRDDVPPDNDCEQEQKYTSKGMGTEAASKKKRKSDKYKDGSHKKVKSAKAYASVATIYQEA